MGERGYIMETTAGLRGHPGSVVYWVTMGSATSNFDEAGLFTREQFEALHFKDKLTFIPQSDGSASADAEKDKE